jgi:hypothetical protein
MPGDPGDTAHAKTKAKTKTNARFGLGGPHATTTHMLAAAARLAAS